MVKPFRLAPGLYTCPAHDDRSPSLSVTQRLGGVFDVHCFAGCAREKVLRACGLEWADLYPRHVRPLWTAPRVDSVAEIIRQALTIEAGQVARMEPYAADFTLAAHIRRLQRLADAARALADTLGPESDAGWALREFAASCETRLCLIAAALDE